MGIMIPPSEGALISGHYALGNVPERYRNAAGMDRLSALQIITRQTTRFSHYLNEHSGFAKAERVNTFEPKTHDIRELDFEIPITADPIDVNDPGSNYRVVVANRHADPVLKVNDLVTINNIYYEPLLPVNERYSNTFGKTNINGTDRFYVKNELCYIIQVDAPDSGGTGNAVVHLRRAIASTWEYGNPSNAIQPSTVNFTQPPGGTLMAAPTTCAPIYPVSTVGIPTILMKTGNAYAHGTGPARGDYKNPILDGNYLQELKWAVDTVMEAELESYIQKSEIASIQTQLKMKQMAWDHERLNLFGRQAKTYNHEGNALYFSGGVIEYIKADAAHILEYQASGQVQPTINHIDLNTSFNPVFDIGGSEHKVAFTGSDLLTRLQNAFWNKVMFVDGEKTADFHIPVYKIMCASGEVDVVATWGMQQAGYRNAMLILDLSVPAFVRQTMAGELNLGGGKTVMGDFDLWVENDIRRDGVMTSKKQYISIQGMQRRCQDYHCIMHGFPQEVSRQNTYTNA